MLQHGRPTALAAQGERDPTRTTVLRSRFTGGITKRTRAIKGAIRKTILDRNALGNVGRPSTQAAGTEYGVQPPPSREWANLDPGDQVQAFMDWLHQVQQKTILQQTSNPTTGSSEIWAARFVREAYQRGVERGRAELLQAGYPVQSIEDEGGIELVLQKDQHRKRMSALIAECRQELEGIAAAVRQQVSRRLTDVLVLGEINTQALVTLAGSRDLVNAVNNRVDKVGGTRGKIEARTRTIKAVNQAAAQEYKDAGIEELAVKVEYRTQDDSKVCPECARLHDKVFAVHDIESIIPVHPN